MILFIQGGKEGVQIAPASGPVEGRTASGRSEQDARLVRALAQADGEYPAEVREWIKAEGIRTLVRAIVESMRLSYEDELSLQMVFYSRSVEKMHESLKMRY